VQIPDQDKESSYIANACHFLGIEKTKSEIEKILKIKSDYTVKVGFSQVMGILRSIKLPASDTLQFLRNRSVVFGDYQRSHNQGVFIKDMIVNHLREFNNIPKPLTYFIYKTIDTDLPYDLFYTIAENLNEANFKQSPEKITLVTKTAEDLPFSDKHLYNSLNNTNTNSEDLQDFQDFQKTVQEKTDKIINTAKNYYDLQNLNACYNIIKTPFQQRIWYQMENENQRYENEYQILKTYVECSSDKTNLSSAVLDFINEMEIGNQPDYKKRGEELLSQIIDNR
jgi:anionic cell wall polymer biosynthesis LytR-Cps2A-Psr (LCP) family protein